MDNEFKCKICNKEFDSSRSLHSHFRAHDTTIEAYYHNYYPKVDLLTNEPLIFKDIDSYFNFDFNSRHNLVSWITKVDKREAQDYFIKLLKWRKDKKGIVYSPCQVELRSCNQTLSILAYTTVFEDRDYYEFCEKQLGFVSRFKDHYRIPYYKELPNPFIQIDTREQQPIDFGQRASEIVYKKLDFGDYKLFNENGYEVYFERKSLSDFIGTLSSGFTRFENEIIRAQSEGKYLIIIVENLLSSCLNFNTENLVFNKFKVTPEYVFHNVRELIQHYSNIQFLFVKNREEMATLMNRIYLSAAKYKEVDLQLLYDTKNI